MMEWKMRRDGRALQLLLGKWEVGGACYDGFASQGGEEKYKAWVNLPGLKSLGHFKTEAKAKKQVETAVLYWIKHAWLVPSDGPLEAGSGGNHAVVPPRAPACEQEGRR